MSEQQSTADERLAEAMASFGRGITPPEDGWADVVSGRAVAPGRQRLVVALAAAVLVAALVAAGATIATRGGGEPARATIPPTEPVAPPSTEAITTTTTTTTTTVVSPPSSQVPDDTNDRIVACLDERGVAYSITPADGGYGIGPPEPSTQAQRVAFNDGLDACYVRSDASPEERAEIQAYAEQYFDDLVTCLDEAGIAADAVQSQAGIWDVVTPGVDQTSTDYRAVFTPCAEQAQANEAATRAANGDQ